MRPSPTADSLSFPYTTYLCLIAYIRDILLMRALATLLHSFLRQHAVEAMLNSTGTKRDYTCEEMDSSGEKLLQHRTKTDLRVPSPRYFSHKYIRLQCWRSSRQIGATLLALLRPQDRYYIDIHWRKVEDAV